MLRMLQPCRGEPRHHYHADTDRISPDVYATTRRDELSRTYDECDEQGAPGLHTGDNDAVPR